MTLRDIQRLSIRPRKWEINCSAAMLYRMLGRKALFYMIAVSWDNKKQKKGGLRPGLLCLKSALLYICTCVVFSPGLANYRPIAIGKPRRPCI